MNKLVLKKNEYKGAIIGMGGLACPALLSLIQAWCPETKLNLSIFDGDLIDISNLNRQFLFKENDINKNKAKTSIENISNLVKIPDNIELVAKEEFITKDEIDKKISSYDFIFDCTDSISLKLSLSNSVKTSNSILIYGGVEGTSGLCILIHKDGPGLDDIFGVFSEEEISTLGGACQEVGIIGATAGIIGSLQVELLLNALSSSFEFRENITEGFQLFNLKIKKKYFTKPDEH